MSVLHATTSAPKLLRHPYFPAWPFDPTQNPYRAWNTEQAYYTASQAFFCTIGQRPIKSRSSWFGKQYLLMTVNGEIVPCLNEPQQSNITGISEAETDEDKILMCPKVPPLVFGIDIDINQPWPSKVRHTKGDNCCSESLDQSTAFTRSLHYSNFYCFIHFWCVQNLRSFHPEPSIRWWDKSYTSCWRCHF